MDRHPEDELPPRRELRGCRAPPAWWRSSTRTRASASSSRASSTSSGSVPRRSRVLVEPLYGSGAGWFTRLLGDGRLTLRRAAHRAQPVFRRRQPRADPPQHRRVAGGDPALGRATSGSPSTATRTGSGWRPRRASSSTSCRSTALLYWYLLDVRGQIGPAVYTVTSTSMAKRLAEIYGTQAYETGVGFKYVGPKMTETHAVIGGEESGGFGFGMHIPERDGLASGLFLLDLWLTQGQAGVRGAGGAPGARRSELLQPDRHPLRARGVRRGEGRYARPARARGADRARRDGRRASGRSSTRTTASSSTATTARGS